MSAFFQVLKCFTIQNVKTLRKWWETLHRVPSRPRGVLKYKTVSIYPMTWRTWTSISVSGQDAFTWGTVHQLQDQRTTSHDARSTGKEIPAAGQTDVSGTNNTKKQNRPWLNNKNHPFTHTQALTIWITPWQKNMSQRWWISSLRGPTHFSSGGETWKLSVIPSNTRGPTGIKTQQL